MCTRGFILQFCGEFWPDWLSHGNTVFTTKPRPQADVRRVLAFFYSAVDLHMNVDPFKDVGGRPLLELFCEDRKGQYRNLFETGTGGGGLGSNVLHINKL